VKENKQSGFGKYFSHEDWFRYWQVLGQLRLYGFISKKTFDKVMALAPKGEFYQELLNNKDFIYLRRAKGYNIRQVEL